MNLAHTVSVTEQEFLLADRIQKIRQMYSDYGLESRAYISFSGGKDSTVLSRLFDIAVPQNKIPRVYINTGIDYSDIVRFVKEFGERDKRLVIIQPSKNIRAVLEQYGYPFKSKEHSQKVAVYQHSGRGKTVLNYLGLGNKKSFLCPEKLRYNFSPDFHLKVSDKCCLKLKKEPAEKWAEENGRTITITGMRQSEGGLRKSHSSCAVFEENGKLKKFHPLMPVSELFVSYVVEKYKIKLCRLYYPPYNFKRTGCKGCPFSTDLQKQLDVMLEYLPAEKRQCEAIWKPVYDEYRRIGYRLENSLF